MIKFITFHDGKVYSQTTFCTAFCQVFFSRLLTKGQINPAAFHSRPFRISLRPHHIVRHHHQLPLCLSMGPGTTQCSSTLTQGVLFHQNHNLICLLYSCLWMASTPLCPLLSLICLHMQPLFLTSKGKKKNLFKFLSFPFCTSPSLVQDNSSYNTNVQQDTLLSLKMKQIRDFQLQTCSTQCSSEKENQNSAVK